MKKEDLTPYIQSLLATMDVADVEKEVQPTISAVVAYMAGLEGKDFPLNQVVSTNLDIKEAVPAPFHTLVAQVATLRGGMGGRIAGYLYENCEKLADDMRSYSTTRRR